MTKIDSDETISPEIMEKVCCIRLVISHEPTIYISGQMSGVANLNFPKFNFYARFFRNQGFKVMNPAEHHEHTHRSWFWYIIEDLKWIEQEQPEYFFMLRGWNNSHGAVIEHTTAHKIGATIIYE